MVDEGGLFIHIIRGIIWLSGFIAVPSAVTGWALIVGMTSAIQSLVHVSMNQPFRCWVEKNDGVGVSPVLSNVNQVGHEGRRAIQKDLQHNITMVVVRDD